MRPVGRISPRPDTLNLSVKHVCAVVTPRHGSWVLGLGPPGATGSWVLEPARGLGLGSWVLGPPEPGLWSLKLIKTRKKSSWNEGKLRFSFIFAQKDTGRTPSHLWYFGQRCWLLFDLTDFFGYNTKLPLHMGRAERAAIFLTVTDWVLGLGPPADAGSWVLGLQGTLGLGSWGQGPRPMSGGE